MSTLLWIASGAGALLTIMTFMAFVVKPLRKWIVKSILSKHEEEENKKTLDEIMKKLDKLSDKGDISDEASRCLLRNSITTIYNTYKKEKRLPEYTRENLSKMFNTYHDYLNGNCYVEKIYNDMMTWEADD